MRTVLFFSVVSFTFVLPGDPCPKFISCESSENPDACPQGTFYRENVRVHKCCPGCVKLKGPNQDCTSNADCEPGLKCENTKCELDPSQACEYYKRADKIWKNRKYWKPLCLPDGNYASKQCKGEKMAGKCFCVNKNGNRIFGEEEWSKAENMTCACSRLVDKLKESGQKTGLHCDHMGNFEPFQCEDKVCWCANPTSGIPYTVMVSLEMMASLPCFNRNAMGSQYYRQCDSANRAEDIAMSLLNNHGTTRITLDSHKCNFDGSYHRVQIVREKNRCVYINNAPLTQEFEAGKSKCNCIYDKHVAGLSQNSFFLECRGDGNYKERQTWNGKVYCVDQDGFHFSDNPDDCPETQKFSATDVS